MSVRIVVVPNVKRVLEPDRGVQREKRKRAERAAVIARATAPRLTGAYANSIGVEEDGDDFQLVATDFKAHWIEFGTIRTRAHRTLTNAADAVANRIRVE